MKKNVCAMILFVTLVFHSQCKSEEIAYKVSWSNEVLLPYENMDFPNISNDGKKIVFIRYNDINMPPNIGEIWSASTDGSGMKRLFGEKGLNVTSPIYSTDGTKIIFLKRSEFEMWQMSAEGSGLKPLTEKKFEKFNPLFMPDGTKIIFGVLGTEPPGIYLIDLAEKTQRLIFSTTSLPLLNPSFTIAPDSKTIALLSSQDLIFLNVDGSFKEKITIKQALNGDEQPIWSPNGQYIVIGNILYVIATGEEVPFLPSSVVRYTVAGKPDLIGPKSITMSKDGKKIAFVMEEPNAKVYRAKIRIMDLVWK